MEWITQKVSTAVGETTTNLYAYDSLDRLVSESTLGVSVTSVVEYAYDLAGNRLVRRSLGEGGTNEVTYTLGVGNRLESWDTQRENPGQGQGQGRGKGKGRGNSGSHVQTRTSTIRHDDAGNVTRIHYKDETPARLLDIEWNERYQITAVYTNDALAEKYGYDALGRRVWISDGSTTNYLVYDGIHVVAEVDASGSLQRSYTYGPSVDDILAMTDHTSTQTYYYVKDHLGSVVAIVDSTGTNVVETYEYDAYGQVTVYTNGTEVSESTVGNRYTFQGREVSWRTGLCHFRARSYCPVIGRWLSRDKIGIAGGLDQYVFVGDNPVMLLDPLGLCDEDGYWKRSFRQLILGNLTDDVTLLGTGMQIATGFIGIDLPADVRDISADVGGWEWSWGHAGQTGLDLVGVLPVVGMLKFGDEAALLIKHGKRSRRIKNAAEAVENLDSLEAAQKALRTGKLRGVIIDSAGKSQQRVDNALKSIRSMEDAIEEGL